MTNTIRILFFGDIVGSAGRTGIKHQLPLWRKKFNPDFVIANIENVAHGFGMGYTQINDIMDLGVDVMTGGNHILKGRDAFEILDDETISAIRPLNVSQAWPGKGIITKNITKNGNETSVTVINLLGQHGMREHYNSPYDAVETALKDNIVKQSIIIVDWHAEATSEKVLMGWFLDGRVSAVLGTHTHITTADERILPNGTALIADVGMTGPHNSIIGTKIDSSLEKHSKQLPIKLEIEEDGPIEINAVLVDVDPTTKKALKIERLRNIVEL